MRVYVDSSVVLRIVLGEPDPLKEWTVIDRPLASVLLQVEGLRAMDRLSTTRPHDQVRRAFGALHEAIERVRLVKLSDDVITQAGQAFGPPLKTLDALHLSTAIVIRTALGVPIIFATHDRAQANAARSMEFEVIGYL